MDIVQFRFYGNEVKLDVLTSRKDGETNLSENDYLQERANQDTTILIKGSEKHESLYDWCKEFSSQVIKLKRNDVTFIFTEKVLN